VEKTLKKIKNVEVLLVGKNVKKIKGNNCKYFDNNKEIIDYLSSFNLKNTTILIKASRKIHLEEVTDYLLKIL